MDKSKTFFDVHLHAFNLSHAGLLAFVNRFLLDSELTFSDIYNKKYFKIAWIVIKKVLKSIFKKKKKKQSGGGFHRIVNVLSIFENDIARQFQYLELDYLRFSQNPEMTNQITNISAPVNYREFSKKIQEAWAESGEKITISKMDFEKVILTPLMMDFRNKGFEGLDKDKIHYHLAPRKQIKDQANDLFTGIKQYYDYSQVKLFEIYPFLAINTQNLELSSESGGYYKRSLDYILELYFNDFNGNDSGIERYNNLSGKLQKFKENDNPLDSTNYYYAGIKVYPPLGFDPWPSNEKENDKAKYLYEYCINKNIPMTSHCSDGGFVIDSKEIAKKNTNPEKWKNVLNNYPELKLNFAHDGIHSGNKVDNAWAKAILKFIVEGKNVYFDLSFNGVEKDYYHRLQAFIYANYSNEEDLKQIASRMLFGTDFMVNLFAIDSCYEYVKIFSESRAFVADGFFNKNTICTSNPFEFVFGK